MSRMRFKLTIEYAGTRYSGWQIQKNARTIQGEIDGALRGIGARDFELYGSGRTDAGVHALAQVAHLDLDTSLPPETLRRQVNDDLPSDINILRIEPVRHRFHARHDAVARSYIYQLARRRTAFAKPFVWWVKDDLDVAAMRSLAGRFVGLHDFQSFSDDDPDEKSTEVLVEVGRGALPEAEAVAMLQERSPLPARLTAPASGLFLERVYYEGDPRDRPVQPAVIIPAVAAAPPGASGSAERRPPSPMRRGRGPGRPHARRRS